jgi:plasmid stabilization system protein ParE
MGGADAAARWIAEHSSPAQAERWYQGLFERMETLSGQPLRCPVIAESRRFPEELRELLYGKRNNKYRIIFTIRGADVVILSIRHGARGELRPDEDPGD